MKGSVTFSNVVPDVVAGEKVTRKRSDYIYNAMKREMAATARALSVSGMPPSRFEAAPVGSSSKHI